MTKVNHVLSHKGQGQESLEVLCIH